MLKCIYISPIDYLLPTKANISLYSMPSVEMRDLIRWKPNELEDLLHSVNKRLLFIIGCLKCPCLLSLFHLKNSLQCIKTNAIVSKFSPVHFTSSALWTRMSPVRPYIRRNRTSWNWELANKSREIVSSPSSPSPNAEGGKRGVSEREVRRGP